MAGGTKKSLGQDIDDVIGALEALNESERLIAVKAVSEHLSIPLGTGGSTTTSLVEPPATEKIEPPATQKITDIRSLKESKNPKTATEMVCVVAYYLENYASGNEKKNEIQKKDIKTYFKQGNFPLPKVSSQVLIDAKASGYFDSSGRGKYKLNPVGHNLVVHSLPRTKG